MARSLHRFAPGTAHCGQRRRLDFSAPFSARAKSAPFFSPIKHAVKIGPDLLSPLLPLSTISAGGVKGGRDSVHHKVGPRVVGVGFSGQKPASGHSKVAPGFYLP